jgi:hypothetical protein
MPCRVHQVKSIAGSRRGNGSGWDDDVSALDPVPEDVSDPTLLCPDHDRILGLLPELECQVPGNVIAQEKLDTNPDRALGGTSTPPNPSDPSSVLQRNRE